MAQKRGAARQLTASNWDEPDEAGEAGEAGRYEAAPADVLRSRTIRTARRRNPAQPDQEKKGIFSGFSGFGKAPATTPAASFSFLNNLTNGKSDDKKTENVNFNFPTSTPKIPVSEAKPSSNNSFNSIKPAETNKNEDKTNSITSNKIEKPSENNEAPIVPKGNEEYYSNLKNLNHSVSEWIQTHVEKNPYCILTPIFDDYTNYFKELQNSKTEKLNNDKDKDEPAPKPDISSVFKSGNSDKKIESSPSKPTSVFSNSFTSPKSDGDSKSSEAKTTVGSSLFNQGFSSTPISKSSMFSFGQSSAWSTTTPTTSPSTGFSIGGSQPFPFGNTTPKESAPMSQPTEEDESDEPPKVTFTPVVEEDSVFSKRCKVFIKKDGTFSDRGIGTLYIKPIKDNEKFQLIVRADTSLGNLLVNIVLSESIPTQRSGKNNVMLVCIPLSDVDDKPVPTLLRVKTAEEADGLLETLNKFKR